MESSLAGSFPLSAIFQAIVWLTSNVLLECAGEESRRVGALMLQALKGQIRGFTDLLIAAAEVMTGTGNKLKPITRKQAIDCCCKTK